MNRKIASGYMLACLAVALAPFLIPAILVGTDIHKHLLVAYVITHFQDPALRYRDYLELQWAPVPTALGELALALLSTIFPPLVSEKVYYVLLGLGLWAGAGFYRNKLGSHVLLPVLLFPLLHDFFFFSAFLPYIASVVTFPLLLGVLLEPGSGLVKQTKLALLGLLAYGFHLVAGVIACFTMFFFAVHWQGKRLRWPGLPCILPTAVLLTYYQLTKPREGTPVYYGVIGQVKTFLGHNASSLSRVGTAMFLTLFGMLLCMTGYQLLRRDVRDYRLIALGLILIAVGLVMPYQVGAGAMIGARTLPFAVIALVGGINWSGASMRVASNGVLLFLIVSSILNTREEVAVQTSYDQFLSGMSVVKIGSKILPVIEDLAYGGNKYIQPFNSVEDLYNVFRGGSNPYTFSMPNFPTGSALLSTKFPLAFASKFRQLPGDFQGVSEQYDYIVCWGRLTQAKASIQRETDLIFKNGLLFIYRSRNPSPRAR